MTRWLARRAGVEPEEIAWRVVEGPWFENHLGELELDGRKAMLRVERAVTPEGGDGDPSPGAPLRPPALGRGAQAESPGGRALGWPRGCSPSWPGGR